MFHLYAYSVYYLYTTVYKDYLYTSAYVYYLYTTAFFYKMFTQFKYKNTCNKFILFYTKFATYCIKVYNLINNSGGKLLLKFFILFYLFFVSFSSLNATEITFSISDTWQQGKNSSDNNKVHYELLSDPVAYTIGLKDWDSGILGKYRSKYLKKFSLNYTAQYSIANTEYKGVPATGYYKSKLTNQLYEVFISRSLSNNFKIFIGYGFSRTKEYDEGKTTTTGGVYTTHVWTKRWYHPMGLLWTINPKWKLKSQYNRWHKGHSVQNDGVHYEYDYAWGLDFNISKKVSEKFSVFSFYKYWDVDDSDVISGSWFTMHEIEEIGAGVSYKF